MTTPSTAGVVRASSVFPILSTILLMLGGLCVGVGRVYNKTNNVLLSAGILFVAAGELEETCTVIHVYSQVQSCMLVLQMEGSNLYFVRGAIMMMSFICHLKKGTISILHISYNTKQKSCAAPGLFILEKWEPGSEN